MNIRKMVDAPVLVTIIVLVGFAVVSWLAMKPELSGVKESVILYLLGAWQSMASIAVAYWIGSSAGSKSKDDTLAGMASGSTITLNKEPDVPPKEPTNG